MFVPDVNVLLAMHDRDHQSHDAVHQFVSGQTKFRWATCAVTEAGFVRVASSPAYPGIELTPAEAAAILASTAASLGQHTFWQRIPSFLDPELFALEALQGHRQVTDTLLLGVCKINRGKLLTLDSKIRTNTVRGADKNLIEVL